MKLGLEWLREFVEVKDPKEVANLLSLKSVEATISYFDLGVDGNLELLEGFYVAKDGNRVITYKDLGFGVEDRFCLGGQLSVRTLSEALGYGEEIIEIDPTPNRGDLLSVYGLGREIAALTDSHLKPLEAPELKSNAQGLIEIKSQDCELYIGAIIEELEIGPSPQWMVKRLLQCGVRPINALVDITNYVMMLTGQPLHAFDLERITLPLEVRDAKPKEEFITLSGEKLSLGAENLVIADRQEVRALAGVVGGLNSAVSKSTKRCFLEGAYFNARRVRRSFKSVNVRTESSFRFERGVDKRGVKRAFAIALEMIKELCKGKIVKVEIVENLSEEKILRLNPEKLRLYAGKEVKKEDISKALERIGFKCHFENGVLNVKVPGWREHDIKEDVDLIEEFMRLEGLDNFEKKRVCVPASDKEQDLIEELRDRLTSLGLYEVINFSFEGADVYEILGLDVPKIEILNPLVKSLRFIRSNIITGLLKTCAYNQSRHNYSMAIFELDSVYKSKRELYGAGFLIVGEKRLYPARNYDIWDAMEVFHEILKFTQGLEISREKLGFLHPGVQVVYKKDDEIRGFVGILNPEVAKKLELRGEIYVGEVLFEKPVRKKPEFKRISNFAPVVRDLSVVVDREIEVAKLVNLVLEFANVEEVKVFDIYLGVGEGKKSVGLRVKFRDPGKTLSDEEVNAIVGKMLSLLEERFGARLR
ncbi:MAG: phenylalanine--tRNA ligase subunit beta [Aquificaceae bacterium]